MGNTSQVLKVLYTSPHPEIHPIHLYTIHMQHHSATSVYRYMRCYSLDTGVEEGSIVAESSSESSLYQLLEAVGFPKLALVYKKKLGE